MLGSASPRNPSVVRLSRSSNDGQLRRRVAADRQRQIRGRDAATVVDDLDQLDAATPDRHPDPGGAGVDRVFDQLLDDGNRALDDLSGGDLADGSFVEQAKGHAASTQWLHLQSGAVEGPELGYHASRPAHSGGDRARRWAETWGLPVTQKRQGCA